jgi:hypothetical protein
MALGSVTIVKRTVFGDLNVTICDVRPTSGANYTTGGETFGPAQIGATGTILGVLWIGGGTNNANQPVPKWVPSTGKLMQFRQVDASTVGLAEAAAGSDFSSAAHSQRFLVIHR